jgi:hypothetical protein
MRSHVDEEGRTRHHRYQRPREVGAGLGNPCRCVKARAREGGKTAASAVLSPGLQDALVGVHVRPGLAGVEVKRIQP